MSRSTKTIRCSSLQITWDRTDRVGGITQRKLHRLAEEIREVDRAGPVIDVRTPEPLNERFVRITEEPQRQDAAQAFVLTDRPLGARAPRPRDGSR